MSPIEHNVLVLGCDSRSFLSVIRSLGRAGLRVHIAWHLADSVALRSHYVRKVHALPAYDERDTAWLPALRDLLARERFELVIPTNDTSVTALQRHKAELSQHARLYTISDEAFDVLFDKFKTNELAKSLGIRTPRERIVTTVNQAAGLADDFGLPIVLKPRASYNPINPASKLLVRKAYSQAEFDQSLTYMLRVGPVAIQENFSGRGVGVELLLHEGRPRLAFQHERVHEPLLGGGSSYRRSVPLTSELLDASVRLLAALKFTGVAMVEFKVNPQTGQWIFMEVNARFWGSLPLPLAAGADFPLGLYQLLVEGRVRVPNRYRTGLYCRNWLQDAAWQRANWRADRADPTLATRPPARIALDLLINTFTLRERSDTFTLDDPGPAMAEIAGIGQRISSKLRDTVTARWLSTPWMRKRLARRAARELAAARNVLFICKGNVCRSPFAEHAFRRLRPEVQSASAGYYPQPGRPSPRDAISAACEAGLDLACHSSHVIDEAMIQQADAVLIFDLENYDTVVERFPQTRKRIHLVGALRPDGPLLISDPWNTNLDTFRECYRQIEAALKAGLVQNSPPT